MSFGDRLRRMMGLAPRADAAAEGDAPPAQRLRRIRYIRADVLELICEASRANHPNEFGAVMRAEGATITELVLVPGTLGGDKHAILPLGYLPIDSSIVGTVHSPIDSSIVGTVHSHPGPYAIPSSADEQLFRNFGHTHIIIAEPYDEGTWIAYDQDAREIELEVVDA